VIQVLSDVHCEFHRDGGRSFAGSLDPRGVELLVLAGDIAVGAGIAEALGHFCRRYEDADVIYVHGNHEFYRADRATVRHATERAMEENENLTWLDASAVELRGRRVLGAPLWFRQHPDTWRKLGMADFEVIPDFEAWVYAENARAIEFFEASLAEGDVVVTHHLPSQRSVAPEFVGNPLNPFFVCDLEGLIRERRPKLWIHGHTHRSLNYLIGTTSVVCNPFGYAGIEQNSAFDDKLVVF
jgi:predicted phosphodiesterase